MFNLLEITLLIGGLSIAFVGIVHSEWALYKYRKKNTEKFDE